MNSDLSLTHMPAGLPVRGDPRATYRPPSNWTSPCMSPCPFLGWVNCVAELMASDLVGPLARHAPRFFRARRGVVVVAARPAGECEAQGPAPAPAAARLLLHRRPERLAHVVRRVRTRPGRARSRSQIARRRTPGASPTPRARRVVLTDARFHPIGSPSRGLFVFWF